MNSTAMCHKKALEASISAKNPLGGLSGIGHMQTCWVSKVAKYHAGEKGLNISGQPHATKLQKLKRRQLITLKQDVSGVAVHKTPPSTSMQGLNYNLSDDQDTGTIQLIGPLSPDPFGE